jgi:hypothetical protein
MKIYPSPSDWVIEGKGEGLGEGKALSVMMREDRRQKN